MEMFLPFELTQEMLYVLSFVRFPCQMTKRFIFAFAILMWKKNQVCDINSKQFRTFFKGYTLRLKWSGRRSTTELSACNSRHLVVLCTYLLPDWSVSLYEIYECIVREIPTLKAYHNGLCQYCPTLNKYTIPLYLQKP